MKHYVTPELVRLTLPTNDVVKTSEPQTPVGAITTDDYFTDEWWKA